MDFADIANAQLGGFNKTLGLNFTSLSPNEVAVAVPIGPHLLQPYGLVHGGVYASIAETICSVGAAVNAMRDGRGAVGLDNHTSFLRAAREGTIHAVATPVHMGRSTHVWRAELKDDAGRLLATSRVRLMILEQSANVAGEKVSVSDEEVQAAKDALGESDAG